MTKKKVVRLKEVVKNINKRNKHAGSKADKFFKTDLISNMEANSGTIDLLDGFQGLAKALEGSGKWTYDCAPNCYNPKANAEPIDPKLDDKIRRHKSFFGTAPIVYVEALLTEIDRLKAIIYNEQIKGK